MMRFLLETYQEGVDRIQAKELFKEWCRWCSEVRHATGSSTRFGSFVKKVLVDLVRVTGENCPQGVRFRRSRGKRVSTITPMKDFPRGAYLGVVRLNPQINLRNRSLREMVMILC